MRVFATRMSMNWDYGISIRQWNEVNSIRADIKIRIARAENLINSAFNDSTQWDDCVISVNIKMIWIKHAIHNKPAGQVNLRSGVGTSVRNNYIKTCKWQLVKLWTDRDRHQAQHSRGFGVKLSIHIQIWWIDEWRWPLLSCFVNPTVGLKFWVTEWMSRVELRLMTTTANAKAAGGKFEYLDNHQPERPPK